MKRDLLLPRKWESASPGGGRNWGSPRKRPPSAAVFPCSFSPRWRPAGKNVRAESLAKLAEGLEVSADQLLLGRVTDFDLARDLQCLKRLNEEEYQRLMTVMEQFFWALDLPPKDG